MNAIPIKIITENSISSTVIVAWVGVALSIVGLALSIHNYCKSREKVVFHDIIGRYYPYRGLLANGPTNYSAFVRLILTNKSSNPLSIVFVYFDCPDVTYTSSIYIHGNDKDIMLEHDGIKAVHPIVNLIATPFTLAPYTSACVSVLFSRCPNNISSVENITIQTSNKEYKKKIKFLEADSNEALSPGYDVEDNCDHANNDSN